MNKSKFFIILTILFFLLLITTNQPISSSPGNYSETSSHIPSCSEIELAEMQNIFIDYNKWLTNELSSSKTVGAATAILYKDQIAYLKCFGTKKIGYNSPIDEHTIFRLASVSKTITGVLSGILAQNNIIDYNEKVVDILPSFELKNIKNTQELNISHLLSHSSGLVSHAYDDLVESHIPFSTIFSRLKDANILSSPGKCYSYQNVMFSLIDTILSVKTGKDYSQILNQKLFIPTGMKDASSDFESFKNNPNKAYPHSGSNRHYRPLPLNDRYYSTAPAAGINASIYDMSHFLLALLDKNNPILEEKTKQKIFSPIVNSYLHRGYYKYWGNVKNKQYAIGWRLINYKDRDIAYHGGYVNGYKSEIALCQQENIGIVFLSNSPNSVASKSIPQFLNSYFDYIDNTNLISQNNSN